MNEYLKIALSQIPRYFMDLLELTLGPKKFLVTRCVPEDEAVNRAFIFFGMTLLVAAAMQIPMMPQKGNLVLYFAIDAAFVGLIQLATILILRLAWKIVGGKANFRELFMCAAYALAPPLFIFIAFGIIGDVLFQALDPEAHAALRSNPLAPISDESFESSDASELKDLLLYFGFAMASLWFLVAWGAYRQLNRVPKLRSLVAFFLYCVFSVPLLVLSLFFVVYLANI